MNESHAYSLNLTGRSGAFNVVSGTLVKVGRTLKKPAAYATLLGGSCVQTELYVL